MTALRICLIVLLPACIARADFRLLDDEHPLLADVPATSPAKQPFDKDSWSLDLAGSYITHIRFSEDYFTTGSARFNYYVFKNFAFTFGLSGYLIDQPNEDATAGSFDIGGRLHLLRFDGITIYFDGGGSRIFSDTAVPEGGTTYNYIGRIGGGATIHLKDNIHLMLGTRYFHLSNGDVHGRINNPSYDGIESYAGLIFTF
jgi:hypothetical protein